MVLCCLREICNATQASDPLLGKCEYSCDLAQHRFVHHLHSTFSGNRSLTDNWSLNTGSKDWARRKSHKKKKSYETALSFFGISEKDSAEFDYQEDCISAQATLTMLRSSTISVSNSINFAPPFSSADDMLDVSQEDIV